jgi:uncharacterized protein
MATAQSASEASSPDAGFEVQRAQALLADFEHWQDFLLRHQAICDPAQWQGFAWGLMASGQRQISAWREQARLFMDIPEAIEPGSPLDDGLVAYWSLLVQSLADNPWGLLLMLPNDLLPLSRRTAALADWCQSFLTGFGLGSVAGTAMSEEVAELLTEFAAIGQLDDAVAESEENEVAYTDLAEFVRLSVLNLLTLGEAPAAEIRAPEQLLS